MRPGVIAHNQFAPRGIGHDRDAVSNAQSLYRDNLVCD
jgi:hypothetical protein